MNIHLYETREEVDRQAAALISQFIHNNPAAVLGLATGGTPTGIYKRLVDQHRNGALSFQHTTTFNLDEYVGLPSTHPESYRSYMNRHLFEHVDIDITRTYIPNGEAVDPAKECARYDELLEQFGPVDLQLLGIGHNGHIGFNEPAAALESGTQLVKLKDETRQANARFFPSLAEVPTHAITMGIDTILKARSILLIAKGADKADILHRALTGSITTECPASLLQTHANLTVIADREAGAYLHQASHS